MVPGYRDVINSQVLIQPTAQFKCMDAHVRLQNLNDPTCALLEGKRFEHNIVAVRFFDVYEGVFTPVCLKDVRVNLMANFTTERAPVDSPARECSILALLRLEPVLEAYVVDVADASTALANGEQRVLQHVIAVPAEATESFVIIRIVIEDSCWLIHWSGLGFFGRFGFGFGRILLFFLLLDPIFASFVLT